MFSVGTDMELFLMENGKLVSATKYIEGTKFSPDMLDNGGNIQQDNVAMEFATPPVLGENDFIHSVGETMRLALQRLPSGVSVKRMSSTNFPKEELADERTKEFGCDPDFDAWRKGEKNIVPKEQAEKSFRSCGGHVHVGFVEGSGNNFLLEDDGKREMIKAMDALLGIPFTILDSSRESTERKKLYGKAGCHRPTYYGVEYRALSNFWISSPELVKLVYLLTKDSLQLVKDRRVSELVEKIGGSEEAQRIINRGDVSTAKAIWYEIVHHYVSDRAKECFDFCITKKGFDLYKEWSIAK
jgi:hypothetical protein